MVGSIKYQHKNHKKLTKGKCQLIQSPRAAKKKGDEKIKGIEDSPFWCASMGVIAGRNYQTEIWGGVGENLERETLGYRGLCKWKYSLLLSGGQGFLFFWENFIR